MQDAEVLFSSELDASDFEACAAFLALGYANVPPVGGRNLFDDLQPVAGSVDVCRVVRLE